MRIVVEAADVRARPDGAAELVTQALLGEPVVRVGGADGDWLSIACPRQPSALDPRGYPGWVRLEQVSPVAEVDPPSARAPRAPRAPTVAEFIAAARAFGGVRYLWGGMTREGIDCSGLVHVALRQVGVTVPRDAADQQRAARPVPVAELRPGDLCFFAVDGREVHHVGVATRPGVMLHAPRTGTLVVEEPIDEAHLATMVGVGRVIG
jgi:cell wall-associated NlpC family hydrolase